MGFLGQHAPHGEPLDHRARTGKFGISRVHVHAHPQAAAAHGTYQRRRQHLHGAQALQQMPSQRRAAGHQMFVLHDLQRLQPDGGGERIAAKGRAVAAGREHVHHRPVRQERADRQQAAAQRLAQNQPIGPDALVFKRKPAAGAAQPGLHFVQDQQHVLPRAPVAQLGKKTGRRQHNAGLALNRLDQHGAAVGRGGGAHAGHVAKIKKLEARGKRAKTGAVIGLAGGADDGGGAAMKIAARHQNIGLPVRHTLDTVAPAARRLDRGFHRFGTGVHRQGPLKTSHGAELFKKRPERGAVVGARGDGHARQLALRRSHQPRVQVAVADGGVGTHHVEVLTAFDIPHPAIQRMVNDHRHGMVVVGTEFTLSPHAVLRCCCCF